MANVDTSVLSSPINDEIANVPEIELKSDFFLALPQPACNWFA